MSFLKYPEYKDSKIDWLGKVPIHWIVAPLKYGFEVRLGKMLQPESIGLDDELCPYLRAANIQWSGIDLNDIKYMWFSSYERSQLSLKEGDLLVSEGGDVGRSSLWNNELENCFYQNSINRVRSKDTNITKFIYYWLYAVKEKGYIDILCNKSTIAHFTAEKVQTVPVPYPLESEQIKIVSFLDRETSKIDALISEQQKLIELLKEKRQAVISHAVTKGLNPNAKMKDSGVEWLGMVPEGWEVTQFRRFLDEPLTNGVFKKKEDFGSGTLLVNVFDIYQEDFVVNAKDLDRITCTPDEEVIYKVKTGDLFFVRSSLKIEGIATVAVVDTIEEPMVFECHLIRARTLQSLLNGRFCSYLFNSIPYRSRMVMIAKITTMTTIDQEAILSLVVPVPSMKEQLDIIEYLDQISSNYKALINDSQRAIGLLQERRTALISAAVTGKIDVRDPNVWYK